jgi:FkbM family methyltransferase
MRTLAARSTTLGFRLEELWLRLLPHVMRDYSWADVDGFRMFGSTRHQRYLWRLRKGRIEPYTVRLFRELVKPGMVVVDLGAYLGYYTLLAARGMESAGTVYAFECNPVNYRFLLHNLRLNRYRETVVPRSEAVADEVGVLPFSVRGWDLSAGSLWEKSERKQVIDVPSTTLDRALDGQQIDVLKMDIEGGELHALDGMSSMISNSPNLVMFTECNPSALAAAGTSASELLERLHAVGFEVREIHEREQVLRQVSDELSSGEHEDDGSWFVNLYCTKAAALAGGAPGQRFSRSVRASS